MSEKSDVRKAIATVELRPGLGLKQGEVQLGYGVDLEDAGRRIMAFYLHDFDATKAYQSGGYSSIVQYGKQRWDLDRRRTRELVRIGDRLRELPRIDEALCERKIGWSKVEELTKVAVPEYEEAWLEIAMGHSCAELRTEVKLAGAGGKPRDRKDRKGLPEVVFDLRCQVPATLRERLDLARQKLSDERGEAVNEVELQEMMVDLFLQSEEDGTVPGRSNTLASQYLLVLRPDLETGDLLLDGEQGMVPISQVEQACAICDGQVVALHDQAGALGGPTTLQGAGSQGDKLDMGGLTGHLSPAQAAILDRATPDWLRVKVLERDGHGCRCCGSRRQVQVHHIWYRKNGGRTRAYNLISLCARCHALTHVGLLVLVGKREREIVFTNGEGQPLHDPGGLVDREALVEMRRVFASRVFGQSRSETRIGTGPEDGSEAGSETCLQVGGSSEAGGSSEVGGDGVVQLNDIPDEIDISWWARHEELITMKNGRGLEFREGFAQELDDKARSVKARSDKARSDKARSDKAPSNMSQGGIDASDLAMRSEPVIAQGSGELVDAEEMSTWNSESLNIIGHEDVLSRLREEAAGSRARGKVFPHMLLAGPPGTGKTSLALAVAKGQGLRLHRAMGTLIQDVPALLRLVTGLEEGDCLFLDEIHAMPTAVLETLYEVMEGGRLSLTLHCGNRSRCVGLRLPKLTVLAATTEPADLPPALRSRFGIIEYLPYYENEELARILETRAKAEGIDLAKPAAGRMAQCSRGTPREALRLMDSVFNQLTAQKLRTTGPGAKNGARNGSCATMERSTGTVDNAGKVSLAQVENVLERLGYNREGLDALEQRYLGLLREETRPMALHRLAMALGCPEATVRDEIEPHLARMGHVEFTARGRVAPREPAPREPTPREPIAQRSGSQKAMVGDRVSETDAISSPAWGWHPKAPESGSAALAVVSAGVDHCRSDPVSETDAISDLDWGWLEKAPDSGSTGLTVVQAIMRR